MPPRKIHLIKAAQAMPFIDTASRLGAPVKALARQADLPLMSVRKGEGVIGESSLWRFVELASHCPRCKHLGYQTALDHPIAHRGQLGGMAITPGPSLQEILEIFFREVVTESDSCDYRLVKRSGQTWFTRQLVITDAADGWQPELYVLTLIIQIVRLCAPGDWLPSRMRIATRQAPEDVPAEWSHVDIAWGWPRTELLIEDSILKRPPRFSAATGRPTPSTAHTDRDKMLIRDLVDQQIRSRQTGLNHAACELGMSSATLKRRLAGMNTSYSQILADRRLHHGTRLLQNSDISIKAIAETLGYSAVSNFSRAFSKTKGISPSKWRINTSVPPES
ncbi:MAG: hypothetical protein DRR06_13555 [Gammaproteobacteria bacterium]|nr:MAG: hypothetical protein DRR06_13555 [Gammaproteobacteria bacterium]